VKKPGEKAELERPFGLISWIELASPNVRGGKP
jgi:hypothetical protein